MVQLSQLDHLEYREAILDSPEFREKLKKHEKYILDTSKNIKVLLKKFEDVIAASESLKNAQDSFSVCLKEFQIGFVGDTNEEESDIVDTLDSTYFLVQDIKDFSTKMIDTGNNLFKQLDSFRKEKINQFKERKKDYERQTVKYCTTLDKYLASSQSSKRDKNSDEVSEHKELDKDVREENNLFYRKCLEYVLSIQDFEEKWFHFFAESLFAFIQSWTTFYHEGYEKHLEFDPRFSKSHRGIQALSNNFDYFKSKSSELIVNILKDPEYFLNSCDTMSVSEKNKAQSSKQETLGTSARVKQFCKYYKDTKKFEVTPYNQLTNKYHQPEVYYVNNCQKSSSSDKKFVFEISLKDKGFTNVHTYQAPSYEDYKSWFAIMEGKELTPVLSLYSNKTDPVYNLDKNGINFIKRCTSLLEDDKLNEEGIYRKNGVSHKINQFIERNFSNISQSLVESNNHYHLNGNTDHSNSNSSSLISSAHKSIHLTNSSSSSTLSLANHNNNNNNTSNHVIESMTLNQLAALTLSTSPNSIMTTTSNIIRNNSNINLINNNNSNNSLESDDTCTITSALKHYLIHLKEPLMTYSYNQQFLNTCKIENISDRIIEIHKLIYSLPAQNREAIEILMKHLFKVSTQSHLNKMTTSNLATCLGPTVFRTEQESVSNLYNIKFYSEIIEILIVHHEKIFQPTLDASFLKNLIPLKTPPTMMSSAINSGFNNNSVTSIVITTPSLLSNLKSRNNISNSNTQPTNRRGLYEQQAYRQTLINSSKTSVSSDSSQSDREQQLNSTSNLNLNQQISSPVSSSSPTNQFSNNRISTMHNTSNNNTSNYLNNNNNSPSITNNSTITNVPISIQKPININNGNGNKPYKPFNSQTGQFNQRETNGTNAHKTNSPATNVHNPTSRSSTLSLNTCLQSPQNLIYTKTNTNSSPKTFLNTGQNVSTPSLTNSLMSPSVQTDLTINTRYKRARTLYPCEADNPSELSFEANVIISNVRRSKEAGWLEGTYNGKSGLLPGNYVQILDD